MTRRCRFLLSRQSIAGPGRDGSGTTYLKTADTADNENLTMLRQDMLLSGEINLSLHTFLPELSFGGNDVFLYSFRVNEYVSA